MKKTLVVLLCIVIGFTITSCDKVKEVADGIQKVSSAIEDVEKAAENNDEAKKSNSENIDDAKESNSDNNDDEKESSSNDTSATFNSETLEMQVSYLEEMKEFFTNGHRAIGFPYKPMHDQVNEVASYIRVAKNELRTEDYASNFEYSKTSDLFKLMVSDITFETKNDNSTYELVGNGYKTYRHETLMYSYIKEILFEGSDSIYYQHAKDNVKDYDFDRIVQYYFDDNKLYISFTQYNSDSNTISQMLVYYDGQVVQIGHNEALDGTSNQLIYDLTTSHPSSLEDFFGAEIFDVLLNYDGSTTTHKTK